MSIRMDISKMGKDVLTITNPNDFIFKADYNTFKIVSHGVATGQTVNANPKTFSVAHGQTGIPGVFAFAKFPDGNIALPNEKERSDAPPTIDKYWFVEIDSTNVYFIFYRGGSNYNVDISYYIFEVPV